MNNTLISAQFIVKSNNETAIDHAAVDRNLGVFAIDNDRQRSNDSSTSD